MEVPEAAVPALANEPAAGATLVWIDAAKATIIRWSDGASDIIHLESDVPNHRRATGRKRRQPHHEAAAMMGGHMGPGLRTGGYGHPNLDDESHRTEHLRRFVIDVASRLDGDERLLIVGPGTVREQLDRVVQERDGHHRRARVVACEASRLLTERQLVARLRAWAGDPPRRRTSGAYRWTGELATRGSGAALGIPGRISEKPPRTRDLLEEAVEADVVSALAETSLPGADELDRLATRQLASDIEESSGGSDEEPDAPSVSDSPA